jgi:hypothetical protein
MIGSHAYVGQGVGGVEVVDLSLPEAPHSLEVIDTPGYASDLIRVGDLLLVLDGNEGGFMIDVRSPSAPIPIGHLDLPVRSNQILATATKDDLILSGLSGGVYRSPLPHLIDELHLSGEDEAWAELTDMEGLAADTRIYLYDRSQVISRDVDIIVAGHE